MQPKFFFATKAFIIHNEKLLIVRESPAYGDGTHHGQYDVVGGRIHPGEKWDECLLREIKEETGLNVRIGKPFAINEWRPTVKGEPWQIVGVFLECFADSDKVTLDSEHDEYKWIKPEEYKNYPIIENLIHVFDSYLKK